MYEYTGAVMMWLQQTSYMVHVYQLEVIKYVQKGTTQNCRFEQMQYDVAFPHLLTFISLVPKFFSQSVTAFVEKLNDNYLP